MFINLSNHMSEKWSKQQVKEAEKYGEIVDIPFPNIDPKMSEEEVSQLAIKIGNEVREREPSAVLCQGEYTFTYSLVSYLLKHKINVVAAVSERRVEEKFNEETGITERKVLFEFLGFRRYQEI